VIEFASVCLREAVLFCNISFGVNEKNVTAVTEFQLSVHYINAAYFLDLVAILCRADLILLICGIYTSEFSAFSSFASADLKL
jgi:hypothetical protein